MNATRSIKWGFAATATAVVVLAVMPGCELLVQFDRNLIDGGAIDATMSDSPQGDAPAMVDGSTEAAADDGSADALAEAASDGGVDSPAEARADSGVDSPVAPADTGVDGPVDGPPADVGIDIGVDAPPDVGSGGSGDAADDGADSGGADGDDSG